MRAYVELVPDAPDAKGAREQSYVWQDKLKLLETVVFRDRATKLMWPRQDSGSEISLSDAVNYCTNLNLAGFSGWRLPTYNELETIYDKKKKVNGSHIKGGIKLSARCGSVWHSADNQISFGPGFDCSHRQPTSPVLCVRRSGE